MKGEDKGEPGPASCDKKGFVLTTSYLNAKFHDVLEKFK